MCDRIYRAQWAELIYIVCEFMFLQLPGVVYIEGILEMIPKNFQMTLSRRDSTDGKAAALYPEDPGSNPVDSFSMLQRALTNNE